MGFNCPHCSKDIDNVVPLDRFQSVIAEKNAASELASKAEKERAEALEYIRLEEEEQHQQMVQWMDLN